MQRFFLAFLSLIGVGVQADTQVLWPEHGSIKASIPKSPSKLKFELPNCLLITADWKKDEVSVQKHGDSKPIVLNSSGRMLEDGGQLVILFSLEEGQAHIIANVETKDGSLETRTTSFPHQKCQLSKLHVSCPESEELKGLIVAVSEEIQQLYMQNANATA